MPRVRFALTAAVFLIFFNEHAPALTETTSSPIVQSIDSRLIWNVNPLGNSVSVLRTDTNALLATIPTGAEPQSVALTPNGQYAYVANAADGTVSVIKINDSAWGTFSAALDTTAGTGGHITTGAEPWSVVCSPDGNRIFVANSSQDSITVINTATRGIIGHVNLRTSIANDPDRTRHFQPRGLAVTADSTKLYVTRFLSFTKPGGRQGDDFGKEGLVAVLNINTASTSIADYSVARTVTLAPQFTGFNHPDLPGTTTGAFPNQLQSIVLRGDRAYLPNIAASPSGPLRFNIDTQAFVNVITGTNGTSPADGGSANLLNLHLGARNPEPGKTKLFFSNPCAMAFTTASGAGNAYVVSSGSDLLVKLNVGAGGALDFTGGTDRTRYIDLNNPANPATSGVNAGKNPRGIVINSSGTRAYVSNFVSCNVSIVDLTTDTVLGATATSPLPAPNSQAEQNLVGAEMFFSSRGNFDTLPGSSSLQNRLSSEGWQSCASCHPSGLTDGVVWSFGAGPRKTIALNSTFLPQDRTKQRALNYSAIFDEVEDFEANIRNVSGPGPLSGGGLNSNFGLLLGENGSLDTPPSALNAFSLPNSGRPQLTVTLPGSTAKVPALTALREWVRNAVRSPQAPLLIPGLPNAPTTLTLLNGRSHWVYTQCSNCHGPPGWSSSYLRLLPPPAVGDIFTERSPTPFTANPVGTQYLNRFLRDIGSFNLGVPGQGNLLGLNIGADEKAAPIVSGGVLQPAQDALGFDYNSDGKGTGFNPPSLISAYSLPPYGHNGAAESLTNLMANFKHRTINGTISDPWTPTRVAEGVAFFESIDANSDPFPVLDIRQSGNSAILSFGTIYGAHYTVSSRTSLPPPGSWTPLQTVTGTGRKVEIPVAINKPRDFFRVTEAP